MRNWTALALAGGIALCSLSAATQMAARALGRQSALGYVLVSQRGEPLFYWPHAVLMWSFRWGERHPRQFALAHFVLIAGAATALFAATAILQARAPRIKRHGGDGWAERNEVQAAGLFAASGAVIGKFENEILAYDGPGHTLLVGASRSGKGRGLVVPTLLAWPHSALVLDVKGELADGDARHGFAGCAAFRQGLGPVLRFAPTRPQSARFNPLFEVRRGANEVRDVQNITEIVVDPAGDGRHNDFWERSARQIITGVILDVLYAEPDERKTLAVVRERLSDLDTHAERMRRRLHRCNPSTGEAEVHPEVLHAAQSYLCGEERMRSGLKATAESFFTLFADPLVAQNTGASDFRVGDLMCAERPVTLFLQPPPSDALRLMPLMRLVINQIARALMESQEEDALGRQKLRPLLLMLDEFPQLGRLAFFETAMGAFAGFGLRAFLVCQSLNHITRAYGRDNVIIDNCHLVIAFAAADAETAKTISAMAGERWQIVESESVNRPRALLARRGATQFREERRPLLLPSEVRALSGGEELIFAAGRKPIRARKLAFDREPMFAARAKTHPEPAHSTLTTKHDWQGVRALGELPAPVTPAKKAARASPALAAHASPHRQGDLFSLPRQERGAGPQR